MNIVRWLRACPCNRSKEAADEIERLTNNADNLRQQVEDLTKERDALRELMNCYNLGGWTDAEQLQKERDEARAELDALRLDAERWRWWREQVKLLRTLISAQAMLWNCSPSRTKLDATVDAAMKEKP